MEHRRPENIPGYEHPEENNIVKSSNVGYYKTFTEGKTPKKNEKFKKTEVNAKYGKINNDDDNLCPFCKSPPIFTCPCGYSDKKCQNEHIWYTGRDGTIKKGNPH